MDVRLTVSPARWQQWFAVGSLVWLFQVPDQLVPHTLALMCEEERLSYSHKPGDFCCLDVI